MEGETAVVDEDAASAHALDALSHVDSGERNGCAVSEGSQSRANLERTAFCHKNPAGRQLTVRAVIKAQHALKREREREEGGERRREYINGRDFNIEGIEGNLKKILNGRFN